MSHSVRKHLGVEIDAYDETIRRFIPGYETALTVAADVVAAVAAGPLEVCGRQCPQWHAGRDSNPRPSGSV